MLFSSYNFVLLFLPIVVFIFYILKKNKHKKLQLYWLILVSFSFPNILNISSALPFSIPVLLWNSKSALCKMLQRHCYSITQKASGF